MANQFDLTSGQLDASNRHDLQEVVYLLSGTLPGRGTVPDQVFYWSTRRVTVPLGAAGADVTFLPYLSAPRAVERRMGFEPGDPATTPAVPILVRNLPFAHSESLIAAFTDDDFAMEAATVTLRVAYLRAGQSVEDLVAADFSSLVLEGFFGAPTDVRLDGFTLPVYNRGAKRSMVLKWPQLPETLPYFADHPGGSSRGGYPIDRESLAQYVPLVFGRPEGWFMPMVEAAPARGFTVSAYSTGDTVVKVALKSVGARMEFYCLGAGKLWSINNRWPAYTLASGTLDEAKQEVTLYLTSGLALNIPRGAYAENQDITMSWVVAPHPQYAGGSEFGWRLKDGTIKEDRTLEADLDKAFGNTATAPRIQCKLIGHGELDGDDVGTNRGGGLGWCLVHHDGGGGESYEPHVYYDPAETLDVTVQPEFDQVYTSTWEGRATGGNDGTTGGDNADARNGNLSTGCTGSAGQYFELDFPEADPPFGNGSTTHSTLIVHAIGVVSFESESGSRVYGVTPSRSEAMTYEFSQATKVSMGQTLRCEFGGAGGTVLDAVWRHTLETTSAADRTTDTAIGTGVEVGETMVYADLVMRFPQGYRNGWTPPYVNGPGIASMEVSGSRDAPTFHSIWDTATRGDTLRYPLAWDTNPEPVPVEWAQTETPLIRPTQAMIGLHALLGKEGHTDFINLGSYDAAHARFNELDIRVNAMVEPFESWFDLERAFGEQYRSVWYYGPSGHEVIVLEDEATLEASGVNVRQSFRLPGTPAANCFQTTSPFMSRTPVGELVNTVAGQYKTDYLTGESLTESVEKTNSGSVARSGTLRRAEGPYLFPLHNEIPYAVSGGIPWTVSGQVGGILQLYADRKAYARTRFTFETGWIAHGLDRGSIIRVAYPVSTEPESYRNNICEVESVVSDPLNAERYTITARSVNKPQKGLDPATIWTDVFTDASDQWTTRVTQEFDTWADYWAQPDS